MKRIFLILTMGFVAFPALAANKIVASYPPIQSLVWGITEGVAPVSSVFTKAQENHHDIQLKPSQMKVLKGADIVFYASDDLETFMEDALKAVAPNAKAYSLMKEIPELNLLPSSKDSEKKDVHYWLDTANAILMLDKIADIMIENDPKNKNKYEANRKKSKDYIKKLQDIEKPDTSKKFIAFHEGFEYMAKSFDLNIQTADVDVENINTPQAAYKLKQQMQNSNADCFLLEPHITRKQIKALGLKHNKNIVKMDAFGWNIDGGPGQYYNMMRWNLKALNKCKAKK